MVSIQFIVFKCKVNICDQDLGAFCQERGREEKKFVGEDQGATEPPAGRGVGALVDAGRGCGGVDWR